MLRMLFILLLLLSFSLKAQEITNTLGRNGEFVVEDNLSNKLLTIDDSGNMIVYGNLTISNGTASYTFPESDGKPNIEK